MKHRAVLRLMITLGCLLTLLFIGLDAQAADPPNCSYSATGIVSAVYRGASLERIELFSTDPNCIQKPYANFDEPNDILQVKSTAGAVLAGRFETRKNRLFLYLWNIPSDFAGASLVEATHGSDSVKLDVPIRDSFSLKKSLNVTYPNGLSAESRTDDAVELGVAVRGIDHNIVNTATLHTPTGLFSSTDPDATWVITSLSWPDTTVLGCMNSTSSWLFSLEKPNAVNLDAPCVVPSMSAIHFTVDDAEKDSKQLALTDVPLSIQAEVHTWVVGTDGSKKEILLFRQNIAIAARADAETVSIPLSKNIALKCSDTGGNPGIVLSGEQAAVSDDGILDCRAVVVCSTTNKSMAESIKPADATDPCEKERQQLLLTGPQELEVVVKIDGTDQKETTVWRIDWRKDQRPSWSVPLRVPKQPNAGSPAAYVVEITPHHDAAGTMYRIGSRDDDASHYSARLVPRGPFGLSTGLRAFFTIPVEVTALRFPASSSDLAKSSSSSDYQVVTLKTGVLFGLEPWDYSHGHSGWALPTRLLTGFHLFDLKSGSTAPSFLFGVAMTAPLIDQPSSVTNTSIAMGLYYERDIRDGSNHVLVTLGLNLFALNAPKN